MGLFDMILIGPIVPLKSAVLNDLPGLSLAGSARDSEKQRRQAGQIEFVEQPSLNERREPPPHGFNVRRFVLRV